MPLLQDIFDHALDRGHQRDAILHKDGDYEAFERVLNEGLQKFPVDLLTYCWLPNHWHMVLNPRENGAMGRLLYWVTMTHTARHHAHYHTAGNGHLYQGRYKSFPIQTDEHFFVVMRYVERNALAAGLVEKRRTGGSEGYSTGWVDTVGSSSPNGRYRVFLIGSKG